jgi:hypothetical protein
VAERGKRWLGRALLRGAAGADQLFVHFFDVDLGERGADEDDLYAALDWRAERQERIERRLARRHLRPGEHAPYDVSSSHFEGRSCPLAQLGYSRDRRRGSLQLVYGLLCDRRGRPLAVEPFPGSLHDDQTVPDRLEALSERFGLQRLVLVVDRGMVTEANLAAVGEAATASSARSARRS